MNCLKILLNNKWMKSQEYCRQLSCLQIHLRKESTNSKTDKNFKKTDFNLDNLSDKESAERLIYSGPENMVKMIKMIKTFSISTTLIAAGVQPFIFKEIISTNSSFAMGFAGLTSAGIVVSPLLLNWLTKRYVTHLYYNNETQVFTAWYLNLLLRRVSLKYRSSDVSVPESLGMFTTYTVGPKKKPLFVDPEFVTDFNAYKQMLGYDKPIDMKLDNILNTDQQNEDKTK